MLVITSTEWMLYWILRYTTNLRPTITLHAVLVIRSSSLEHWLVGTSSTGNDPNLSTSGTRHGLLTTTWKTKTSSTLIFIMTDNDSEATRSTREGTTVTKTRLDVTHDGTFWYLIQRKYVTHD